MSREFFVLLREKSRTGEKLNFRDIRSQNEPLYLHNFIHTTEKNAKQLKLIENENYDKVNLIHPKTTLHAMKRNI
jgi:hypothetical protein